MKRKLFFSALLISVFVFCASASDLTGIWYSKMQISEMDKSQREFSWGKDFTALNDNECIVIDDEAEKPRFYVEGFGDFSINEVTKQSVDTYKLVFYFSRGQFDIPCMIHLLTPDTFWIEPIDGISFIHAGQSSVYYRISGPKKTEK